MRPALAEAQLNTTEYEMIILVNIVHAFNVTTTNGSQNFSHSLNQTTPCSHELATVEPLIKNK